MEVRLSTGKKLTSSNSWDDKRQRVKNLVIEKESANINRWLTERHNILEKQLSGLEIANPDYTADHVRTILRIAFNKASDKEKATAIRSKKSLPKLSELYAWYIKHFTINPTPTTQRPLAESSIKTFNVTKSKFIEFCKATKYYDYHEIDMDFYEDFTNWLRAQNYSTNYIGNHIKNLKTVMNYALSRGYHNNIVFKSREFAKPKEEIDHIYLNKKELKSIAKLELEPNLDKTRDLFLIGSYTGLRISDLKRLEKKHITTNSDGTFIEIKSKKTQQRIVIPCNSIVKKIFAKYDNQPPPSKSEQKINDDLKIIAKKAEINDKVNIERTIGGKLKKIPFIKHELVTSHTARRSFCTNAYNAGMRTYDIMAISGHRTERTFYSYIRVSGKEKAIKIAQHKFFK